MPTDQTIDRKQIADLAHCTEGNVRHHEQEWGLLECRLAFKKHPILYDRNQVRIKLAKIKIKVP